MPNWKLERDPNDFFKMKPFIKFIGMCGQEASYLLITLIECLVS